MLGAFPFKWFKVCQVVPAERCVLRRLLHSGTLKWKCEGTKRMDTTGVKGDPSHGHSPEVSKDGPEPVTPTRHHTGNSESPKNKRSTSAQEQRVRPHSESVHESESMGLAPRTTQRTMGPQTGHLGVTCWESKKLRGSSGPREC